MDAALHEEDWLRKIGYIEDDLPFTIGLRLQEPQEEFEMWKLETIITPKRGAHRIYVYEVSILYQNDGTIMKNVFLKHKKALVSSYRG